MAGLMSKKAKQVQACIKHKGFDVAVMELPDATRTARQKVLQPLLGVISGRNSVDTGNDMEYKRLFYAPFNRNIFNIGMVSGPKGKLCT